MRGILTKLATKAVRWIINHPEAIQSQAALKDAVKREVVDELTRHAQGS